MRTCGAHWDLILGNKKIVERKEMEFVVAPEFVEGIRIELEDDGGDDLGKNNEKDDKQEHLW